MGLSFQGARLRGVVFDLDGVLAPTLPNHVKAYQQVLATLGVRVEYIDVALREGQRSREIIQWLAARDGIHLSEDEILRHSEEKNRIYRALDVPPLYPDVVRVLDALKAAGLALGLATGTNRKNVPHVLGAVADRFDAVVAAEDVTRPKPDPEPYAKAAAALSVAPREVVVVENAPLGVASGKAAGAAVVAVTTTLPAERLKEADRVVGSLSEFLDLLEDDA